MSMAISRAKYTGDPGFFGDIFRGIKGAVGGITGGPLGMLAGGARGFMGGRQPPIPTAGPGAVPLDPLRGTMAQIRARTGASEAQVHAAISEKAEMKLRGGRTFFGAEGGLPPITFGGTRVAAEMGAMMGGPGYHLNKSSYFLMSGEFVPEGSRMVKNRKRNPANARATSRAISRITGAKTYAKSLGRISIRKKC